MYTLSELAQHLIKTTAASKGWSLPSHQGSVKLPGDIFKLLPSSEVMQSILKKTFLSSNVIDALPKPKAPGQPAVRMTSVVDVTDFGRPKRRASRASASRPTARRSLERAWRSGMPD